MKKIDKFVDFLIENEKSKHTISAYCFTVKKYFLKYKEINSKNLLDYKKFLLENFSPKTVNARIIAIKL